jgi:hypothetical protein
LQPYVIRQGDYLAKLAYKFGFDADKVWNDPANAQLRQRGQLSQDPNMLYPTDMLYIPYPIVPPVMQSLTTGTTNTFTSDPPTVPVTIQFSDSVLASQAYTVQELEELSGLTTDANGTATFSVPVTLEAVTISFTDSGELFSYNLGCLDPIDKLSGIYQRLQNLGFIDVDIDFDGSNLELIRTALRAFSATQPGAPPAPAEASTPANSSDDNASPPTVPDPPADGSVDNPSQSPQQSASPPGNSPPPAATSADLVASPDAGSTPPADDAGLSDAGTLDSNLSDLLLAAHGS